MILRTAKGKRVLDSRDRDILKLIHSANRPLSGNQIANRIRISPPAIKPRLEGLEGRGILKRVKVGDTRVFQRVFKTRPSVNLPNIKKTINAPSRILWGLDIKKKKK